MKVIAHVENAEEQDNRSDISMTEKDESAIQDMSYISKLSSSDFEIVETNKNIRKTLLKDSITEFCKPCQNVWNTELKIKDSDK